MFAHEADAAVDVGRFIRAVEVSGAEDVGAGNSGARAGLRRILYSKKL